ncbi:MAG: tRNA pseudouridine(38-40) synthase TruA [Planctomycetota bacterium]
MNDSGELEAILEERPRVIPFEARNAPEGTRNILLTISYDGTHYSGWQVQPGRPSVQACVEQAVQAITGESRRVYCAGRTDTGVHALGQAANFYTRSRIPGKNIRRALQTELPDDIVIVEARDVSLQLHATFSAVRKRYRYVIHDRGVCPPFLKRYCAPSRFALDAPRMHDAAQELLGRHDFRCFEKEYPNKETSVRTIFDAVVRRTTGWQLWDAPHDWGTRASAADGDREGGFVVFEVEADGFLYNMVRAIAGTLTEVGRGKRPVHTLRHVIQSLDRNAAGMTAVPQGLYLVQVDYPAELLQASVHQHIP